MRRLSAYNKAIAITVIATGMTAGLATPVSAATYSQSESSCKSSRPILKPNDRGTCVRVAQQLLANKGALSATPNGVYGPATRTAVATVQRQAGLSPANQIGPRTWATLLGSSSSSSKSTSTAGIPAACLRAGKTICLDKYGKTSGKAWALQDRKVVFGPIQVSTGDGRGAKYRTMEGSSKVDFKKKYHESSIYDNAPMPYSIFFYGGQAFHEGNMSASHGCVHVLPGDAARLYNFADTQTMVTITK